MPYMNVEIATNKNKTVCFKDIDIFQVFKRMRDDGYYLRIPPDECGYNAVCLAGENVNSWYIISPPEIVKPVKSKLVIYDGEQNE